MYETSWHTGYMFYFSLQDFQQNFVIVSYDCFRQCRLLRRWSNEQLVLDYSNIKLVIFIDSHINCLFNSKNSVRQEDTEQQKIDLVLYFLNQFKHVKSCLTFKVTGTQYSVRGCNIDLPYSLSFIRAILTPVKSNLTLNETVVI